jgi:hypothetical protein
LRVAGGHGQSGQAYRGRPVVITGKYFEVR